MDQPIPEQYEQAVADLAAFCFRKLANLEARFILLCQRAEKLGIDCSDLHPPIEEIEARTATPGLRILN